MREWKELQRVLAGLGLAWGDVWRLTIDRRARTVVVVALDGRKFTAQLEAGSGGGGGGEQGRMGVLSFFLALFWRERGCR